MPDIDLVIHGHFYQPPRENPWTDEVGAEPGARPFHDWNQRINAECYRPNAFARIVDDAGRIERIVNNYELVSFNLGPTLLRWMQRHDPLTLARLVEADRRSARVRGGHGNAIAQAYGHAILPLCNARDRATQIRWGLAEFAWRFGRGAEALWLPETAASPATLDDLIEHGLRYAILAPSQAARVRRSVQDRDGGNGSGAGPWEDVRGGTIDPSRPYRYSHSDGSGRSLALLFYDGLLARSVAFGGALRESRLFIDACAATAAAPGRQGQVVHLAVDGETWGHHHAWGDRALAYALAREAPARGFHVTNYGELLDRVSPQWDAEIELGEDGLGNAWSCAHGLGRWTRDCSCRLAQREGWTQAWRAPLRAAFDLLRDQAAVFFEQEAGCLLQDPWAARDAYVHVLLEPGEAARARLLREHSRGGLAGEQGVRALQLLEMQHMLVLMYASCGWFFDDIAGLESVQVMRYAARAVDLWSRLGGQPPIGRMLERLGEARSNEPRLGTGADLFRTRAQGAAAPAPQIAAHLLMGAVRGSLPSSGDIGLQHYDAFDVQVQASGHTALVTGRVDLRDERTGAAEAYEGAVLHGGGLEFQVRLRACRAPDELRAAAVALHGDLPHRSEAELLMAMTARFGEHTFGVEALLETGRQQLLTELFGDLVAEAGRAYAQLYGRNQRVIEELGRLGLDLPRELRVAAELTFTNGFERAVDRAHAGRGPADFARALSVIEQARERGIELDRTVAIPLLSRMLEDVFAAWGLAGPGGGAPQERLSATVMTATEVLDLATKLELTLDLHRPQELYYHRVISSGWAARLPAGDRAKVHEIGRRLGFASRLLEQAEEDPAQEAFAVQEASDAPEPAPGAPQPAPVASGAGRRSS
jgi:alpha-amylase/alpha-mannosidase (GH57 family)